MAIILWCTAIVYQHQIKVWGQVCTITCSTVSREKNVLITVILYSPHSLTPTVEIFLLCIATLRLVQCRHTLHTYSVVYRTRDLFVGGALSQVLQYQKLTLRATFVAKEVNP